jgi:hypothetical protein
MIMIRNSGFMISTERGTGRRSMMSAVGTAIAATPTADSIRRRSGRLANRQMPRYRPNPQNAATCTASTGASASRA